MLNQPKAWFWGIVLAIASVFPVQAADKNLIQTLYHTEFTFNQDEAEELFSLDGEIGVLNASGNTDATSLKLGVISEHETLNWNNNYSLDFLYKQTEVESDGEKQDRVSAQRFYGTAQFDYKLEMPGRRLFMYADYENDRFNGYEYRATLASGWSHRMWNTDESMFRYSIGPGYGFVKAEDDTVSNANDGLILRASGEYQYQWYTGSRLRQFLSAEIGANNIKTRSETALSANLFDSLAMKLSFVVAYETQPIGDISGLNTETSLSVVYRFF